MMRALSMSLVCIVASDDGTKEGGLENLVIRTPPAIDFAVAAEGSLQGARELTFTRTRMYPG
jgi:hypothetical protein